MATDPHADVPLTDDVSFAKGEFVPAESVVSDRVATGLTYAEARDNGVLLVEDEAGEPPFRASAAGGEGGASAVRGAAG